MTTKWKKLIPSKEWQEITPPAEENSPEVPSAP